jgi:transcriptional regulator with PAS, ATPase and Fis domain
MVILYDGPILRAAWWEVPQRMNQRNAADFYGKSHLASTPPNHAGNQPVSLNRRQKLETAKQLLEASGNDLTWVAAQLGIHPTTLYRWRKAGKL